MVHISSILDKYSKEEFTKIVEESTSIADICKYVGYKTTKGGNAATIKRRIRLYGIDTDHFIHYTPIKRTYENVFCVDSTASQRILRSWYESVNYPDSCSICGHDINWNGGVLTMILDHINGDHHDNRIENLRWICPNCNSQLPTFAGRNNKRITDDKGA